MRVMLRPDEGTAVVTRSSTVDAGARNKAQLECQRSLWKPGDVMVTGFDGASGTMIVRDWGLTQGVCRRRDTKVRADFIRPDPDVLALSVWRGNTPVVQEWTRVAR